MNLIQNPDFETGILTPWSGGWTISQNNPYSGGYCLEAGWSGGYHDGPHFSQGGFFVEAGIPYKFSFWKRETGTRDTFDPDSSILDIGIVVNGIWYSGIYTPNEHDWTYFEFEMIFRSFQK